jgi:hypothetical protein
MRPRCSQVRTTVVYGSPLPGCCLTLPTPVVALAREVSTKVLHTLESPRDTIANPRPQTGCSRRHASWQRRLSRKADDPPLLRRPEIISPARSNDRILQVGSQRVSSVIYSRSKSCSPQVRSANSGWWPPAGIVTPPSVPGTKPSPLMPAPRPVTGYACSAPLLESPVTASASNGMTTAAESLDSSSTFSAELTSSPALTGQLAP